MLEFVNDNDVVLYFEVPPQKEYGLVITGIAQNTVFKKVKKWYKRNPVFIEVGLDEVSMKMVQHIKEEYKKIKYGRSNK